uniref:Uncharacterized protein n=1 Tax=Sphaerodactylus townsendi TaxID=933632 RepID=A0ACB8EIS0_9SAUR
MGQFGSPIQSSDRQADKGESMHIGNEPGPLPQRSLLVCRMGTEKHLEAGCNSSLPALSPCRMPYSGSHLKTNGVYVHLQTLRVIDEWAEMMQTFPLGLCKLINTHTPHTCTAAYTSMLLTSLVLLYTCMLTEPKRKSTLFPKVRYTHTPLLSFRK